MKQLIILTSSFDPWNEWNAALAKELDKFDLNYRYANLENEAIDSTRSFDRSIYFVRSNSLYAVAVCSYLYYRGATIINGVATTNPWPRMMLLGQFQTHGASVPRSYIGFNLSTLRDAIPLSSYPLIQKTNGAYTENLKIIPTKSELLNLAVRWSFHGKYPTEPFYLEEYFNDEILLAKVYVIGDHLYAFQRNERLEEKIVSEQPTPFELADDIVLILKRIVKSCQLGLISLDILIDKHDKSNWHLIDVNLVPMYAYLKDSNQLICKYLKRISAD